jgi:hypothetical protein
MFLGRTLQSDNPDCDADAGTIRRHGGVLTHPMQFMTRRVINAMVKKVSTELEQEVACSFLLSIRLRDQRDFFMERGRVGLKFIRDRIDPGDQEQFATAFDGLIELGCLPKTLAGTLYSYHSYQVTSHILPMKGAIKDIEKAMRSAVIGIEWLDSCNVMEALARHANSGGPPQGRQVVLKVLHWYIESLSIWRKPRKDIIASYAPVACCMYSKIATGKFQFSLVGDLLHCFGYKPDPKRQKRAERRTIGYTPCDTSLERNFRNFKSRYPIFCERLKTELIHDHGLEEEARPIEPLDKMLCPNDFDWKVVFRPPLP